MPDTQRLTDAADLVIGEMVPGAIATRGIVIVEFLPPGKDFRPVVCLHFGRTPLLPYEMLGMVETIRLDLSAHVMAHIHHPEGGH